MDERIKKYCQETNDFLGLELVRQILLEAKVNGFYINTDADVLHVTMDPELFDECFKDTCRPDKDGYESTYSNCVKAEEDYNEHIVIECFTYNEYITNRIRRDNLNNKISKIDSDIESYTEKKNKLIEQRDLLDREVAKNA